MLLEYGGKCSLFENFRNIITLVQTHLFIQQGGKGLKEKEAYCFCASKMGGPFERGFKREGGLHIQKLRYVLFSKSDPPTYLHAFNNFHSFVA